MPSDPSPHEVEKSPLEIHLEKRSEVVGELKTALSEQDVEAALDLAKQASERTGEDPLNLLRWASYRLIQDEEPAMQEAGWSYFAWEAENAPDPIKGNDISYEAKFFARGEEISRGIAERLFSISAMHFRFAIKKEGFTPTSKFVHELNAAVTRMEENNYPVLYRESIREFIPVIIAAAEIHVPDDSEGRDEDKFEIDGALHRFASELEETDTELSEQARDLITDETWIAIDTAQETISKAARAFFNNDFELARALIASTSHSFGDELWLQMLHRLKSDQPEAVEWSNKVLDTILEANPRYFSQYADADDSSIDFFCAGRRVGHVLGRLDRVDIIDSLIKPTQGQTQAAHTVNGLAYGLGTQNNHERFEHLLSIIPLYSERFLAIVRSSFEEGLKAAAGSSA